MRSKVWVCPKCGEKLIGKKIGLHLAHHAHEGKSPWNKGLRGEEYLEHFKDGKVWNKGKRLSDDHRKNISKSLKGRFSGSKHPMYGKHHSKESLEKMSETLFKEGEQPWNKGKKFGRNPDQSRMMKEKWRSQEFREMMKKLGFDRTGCPPWNKKEWIERVCEWCTKLFSVPPWRVRSGSDHFCSKECEYAWKSKIMMGPNNPNWKGGYEPYYGPNWYQQRRKCLERDAYCCRKCGRTKNDLSYGLEVHHIISFRVFNGDYLRANVLSNLLICVAVAIGKRK